MVGISYSFYVIFGPLVAPILIFMKIGQKTQKCKNVAFGRFWLVGLEGQKMVVASLNAFYVILGLLLAPIPSFIQIGWKTQKLQIFAFGRFW